MLTPGLVALKEMAKSEYQRQKPASGVHRPNCLAVRRHDQGECIQRPYKALIGSGRTGSRAAVVPAWLVC